MIEQKWKIMMLSEEAGKAGVEALTGADGACPVLITSAVEGYT